MNKMKLVMMISLLFELCAGTKALGQSTNGWLSMERYRSFTAEQIKRFSESVESTERVNIGVGDLEETQLVASPGGEFGVYATPVRRDGHIIGFLAGFPFAESALNIFFKLEGEPSGPLADFRLLLLNGTPVGRLRVVGVEKPMLDVDRTSTTLSKIGWAEFFACWGECIGDANYACNKDPKCAALLFASNLVGGAVGAAGIGSFSIAAACGFACTRNPKLDLIPGY